MWENMAQSFAFAVFATLICQINIVFPCKDTKAAKSVAFCDSLPVFCGTELLALCNTSRCLHSLCSVDMTVLAAFATLVCQRNCVFLCKGTKLKNSACAEFLGLLCRFFVAQSFALAAFKKAGKFYFFKSSQTSRERGFGIEILMSCANALCQNPRIRRSRILGLFAGFRLGMRFRL